LSEKWIYRLARIVQGNLKHRRGLNCAAFEMKRLKFRPVHSLFVAKAKLRVKKPRNLKMLFWWEGMQGGGVRVLYHRTRLIGCPGFVLCPTTTHAHIKNTKTIFNIKWRFNWLLRQHDLTIHCYSANEIPPTHNRHQDHLLRVSENWLHRMIGHAAYYVEYALP
jgi:hypothetical protein